MAKKYFTLCLICFSNFLLGQNGYIDTDRPDQTESAFVVPKNYFQAEIGFNIENDNKLTSMVHPTALWKYGLFKRVELRLITELVTEETPLIIPSGNKIITGLMPVQIGGKIALWEEKGVLPKTSLIFHVSIPAFSSSKFSTSHAEPNFRFTMAHNLSDKLGLGYNIGAEWDGVDTSPYWIYTFAPGYSISDKWYAYIELFGSVKKNEIPQHSFDAGFAYNISKDIKLDVSAGKGIAEASQDGYVAIGCSFRLDTKRK